MYFLNIKACQHILLHQIMIFKKKSIIWLHEIDITSQKSE